MCSGDLLNGIMSYFLNGFISGKRYQIQMLNEESRAWFLPACLVDFICILSICACFLSSTSYPLDLNKGKGGKTKKEDIMEKEGFNYYSSIDGNKSDSILSQYKRVPSAEESIRMNAHSSFHTGSCHSLDYEGFQFKIQDQDNHGGI